MATVNKNFRIKNGLIVEGTTGTINGQNILTETGSDSYILNLIGGETLVKSVASGLSVNGSGELSIDRSVVDAYYDPAGSAGQAEINANDYADSLASNYDAAGAAATAQGNAEDYADTVAGTAESNAKSYADSLASNYDAAGAASAAQTAAQGYADGLASNYDAAGAAFSAETSAKGYADSLASNYDAAGAASAAQTAAQGYADGLASNYDPAGAASTAYTDALADANDYTDSAITALNLGSTYDAYGAAATAESNANDYTDTAITNLVDGAPTLLDTLKELAQAIDNDASYASTLTTALGGKQDNLTASTGITIDGSNNISVTANTYDAYGAASTAQGNAEDYADTVAGTAESNAKSYADGLASNYDAAGAASTAESNANSYTDGFVGAVLDGSEPFTAINVNSVSLQKAVQTNLASISTGSSVLSWAKADYASAKLWVKFATATHSQISEVLLTTDSSNNVAITEFAEVGTNGSLGTVTGVYNSGNLAIQVNTVYANTEVTVVATLIK
jgi:hypothetical protein